MAKRGEACQKVRSIGLCLYAYAQDHNGHYPEGKTSTEVFEKLIEGKYAKGPELFYFQTAGKIPPTSSILKAENVAWDMTSCSDSSPPDAVPVIFMTGYKITYQAGTSAMPVNQQPRTWRQWWNGSASPDTFVAIYYYSNSVTVKLPDKDGSIPNFIPVDFDPKGKTYRQLTP